MDGHRDARQHGEDRIEAPQQLSPGDHDGLGGPAKQRRRADGRRRTLRVVNIERFFQDGGEVAHRTHGHVAKVPHPIAETDAEPVVTGTIQGHQQQHAQGHACYGHCRNPAGTNEPPEDAQDQGQPDKVGELDRLIRFGPRRDQYQGYRCRRKAQRHGPPPAKQRRLANAGQHRRRRAAAHPERGRPIHVPAFRHPKKPGRGAYRPGNREAGCQTHDGHRSAGKQRPENQHGRESEQLPLEHGPDPEQQSGGDPPTRRTGRQCPDEKWRQPDIPLRPAERGNDRRWIEPQDQSRQHRQPNRGVRMRREQLRILAFEPVTGQHERPGRRGEHRDAVEIQQRGVELPSVLPAVRAGEMPIGPVDPERRDQKSAGSVVQRILQTALVVGPGITGDLVIDAQIALANGAASLGPGVFNVEAKADRIGLVPCPAMHQHADPDGGNRHGNGKSRRADDGSARSQGER